MSDNVPLDEAAEEGEIETPAGTGSTAGFSDPEGETYDERDAAEDERA